MSNNIMWLKSKQEKTLQSCLEDSIVKAGFTVFPPSSMLLTGALNLSAFYFISTSLDHIFPDLSTSPNVLLLFLDKSMFTG